ncbi:MAG: demethoxyubiquinone hydroxylase family protein [Alphaproteobacteria bacterium]
MKKNLPGSNATSQYLQELLRVNHAGEYGAKRIYAGQLSVLKGSREESSIRHMAEQEEEHLAYFSQKLQEKGVRPTLMHPLWHIGGFALGAFSALIGPQAAMACTVAVEEVIDEHYQEQLERLKENDGEKDLRTAIEKFRADELEHRDTGLEAGAENMPAYPIFSALVKTVCKTAIHLSKKL